MHAVHDSQVFEVLLDQAMDENDKKRTMLYTRFIMPILILVSLPLGYKGGVNHLTRARRIALHRQLLVEFGEQYFNQLQFLEPFAKQPHRLGIRHAVF